MVQDGEVYDNLCMCTCMINIMRSFYEPKRKSDTSCDCDRDPQATYICYGFDSSTLTNSIYQLLNIINCDSSSFTTLKMIMYPTFRLFVHIVYVCTCMYAYVYMLILPDMHIMISVPPLINAASNEKVLPLLPIIRSVLLNSSISKHACWCDHVNMHL